MNKKSSEGRKIISDNRQARFNYHIIETYEAGVALQGTEVKSIREGKVNLRDGYALIRNNEAWLLNVHISPYQKAGEFFNHEPRRSRRLLLHKQEIRKLIGKVEQQGLTLVPLRMYFKRGWVKVDIALAQGKKLHDKRETIKQRDDKRTMQRVMKQY
ncbi:SsrA-binding protein SmpB [Okeania hirsuta]|uniref:SsrA-binding protein SmpB n=1 Tax=Okeania hirsuta TaxID=1458930 RepID=UPI000F51F61B|nr:SsrA-binding protein SmpB [Okeania hirsuta]RQH17917.1 SsrA-binding protein SmpB [Okeania hirsuta]